MTVDVEAVRSDDKWMVRIWSKNCALQQIVYAYFTNRALKFSFVSDDAAPFVTCFKNMSLRAHPSKVGFTHMIEALVDNGKPLAARQTAKIYSNFAPFSTSGVVISLSSSETRGSIPMEHMKMFKDSKTHQIVALGFATKKMQWTDAPNNIALQFLKINGAKNFKISNVQANSDLNIPGEYTFEIDGTLNTWSCTMTVCVPSAIGCVYDMSEVPTMLVSQ